MISAAGEALAIEALTLRYRTERGLLTVLDRVTLSVRPGERVVLLGPSGCGKTSLLKAVAGFLPPAAGSIRVHGRPVAAPGPDRMMIFQEFDQLLPWKTVAGNVAFPLRTAGRCSRKEAEIRAAAAIESVGLTAFADSYPHMLSGGMKQRVAIARALVMSPPILLMDEPFAALDALTRAGMQQELLRMWRGSGVTVLFVTHSIEEAAILGDRIVVMTGNPGTIAAQLAGRPGEDAAGAGDAPLMARLRDLVGGKRDAG
jgi:NitT/TauT family transport system ATP-binding protein